MSLVLFKLPKKKAKRGLKVKLNPWDDEFSEWMKKQKAKAAADEENEAEADDAGTVYNKEPEEDENADEPLVVKSKNPFHDFGKILAEMAKAKGKPVKKRKKSVRKPKISKTKTTDASPAETDPNVAPNPKRKKGSKPVIEPYDPFDL